MKSRLTNIGVLQSGKISAVLYGAVAAIFAPFIFLATAFGEGGFFTALFMVIFMIVLYPLMGFVAGIIMSAIYNFVAGIIGGVELTFEPVDDGSSYTDGYPADEPASE